MIDFNVVPSTPVADSPVADGGAEGADGHPEGAFAEMLSRSLGRELVGRYAQWGRDLGSEQGASRDHEAEHDGVALPVVGAAMPPAGTAPVLDVAGSQARTPSNAQSWGVEPIMGRTDSAVVPTAEVPVAAEPMPTPQTVTPMGSATAATVRRSGVTMPTSRPTTTPPELDTERLLPRGGATPRDAAAPQRWDPAAVRALRPDLMSAHRPSLPHAEVPVTQRTPIVAGRAAAIAERSRGTELDAVHALEAMEALESGPSTVAVTAGGRSAAVVPLGTPAPQPVATGIVERIVQVVEMQRNQAPPRAIAVDLPEFDGLRLVVSMRGDGSVHVAPSGVATTHSMVNPLLAAVGEALVENGFQLAPDGDGGRRSPHQEEEPAPRQPSTPPRRTIGARRTGLRI